MTGEQDDLMRLADKLMVDIADTVTSGASQHVDNLSRSCVDSPFIGTRMNWKITMDIPGVFQLYLYKLYLSLQSFFYFPTARRFYFIK